MSGSIYSYGWSLTIVMTNFLFILRNRQMVCKFSGKVQRQQNRVGLLSLIMYSDADFYKTHYDIELPVFSSILSQGLNFIVMKF